MPLPLFVTLSGPSGIGKSTTLKQLVLRQAEFGLTLSLPAKLTTRPPKPTDNRDEMTYVSSSEFSALEQGNRLLIAYKRHGYSYGLQVPDKAPNGAILIQAMPSTIAAELRRTLADRFRIIAMRLQADPAIVAARLQGRADPISDKERKSRAATAQKPLPEGVDCLIDAEATPDEVATRVARQIKTALINGSAPG